MKVFLLPKPNQVAFMLKHKLIIFMPIPKTATLGYVTKTTNISWQKSPNVLSCMSKLVKGLKCVKWHAKWPLKWSRVCQIELKVDFVDTFPDSDHCEI